MRRVSAKLFHANVLNFFFRFDLFCFLFCNSMSINDICGGGGGSTVLSHTCIMAVKACSDLAAHGQYFARAVSLSHLFFGLCCIRWLAALLSLFVFVSMRSAAARQSDITYEWVRGEMTHCFKKKVCDCLQVHSNCLIRETICLSRCSQSYFIFSLLALHTMRGESTTVYLHAQSVA